MKKVGLPVLVAGLLASTVTFSLSAEEKKKEIVEMKAITVELEEKTVELNKEVKLLAEENQAKEKQTTIYKESIDRYVADLKERELKIKEMKSEVERLKNDIKKKNDELSKWKSYVMTSYTAKCEGCTGYTYTKGIDVRNTTKYNNYNVIAVDKSIIPLGSIVEINDGEKTFKAQALDIGSAIKGNKIDLLVSNKNIAFSNGVQNIKLKVIREGW